MPVPDFSPGEVLTAAAMDSIGLWKIAEVNLTGTTVNIVGCFSSSFDAYRIVISNAKCAGALVAGAQMLNGTTPNASTYNSQRSSVQGASITASSNVGTFGFVATFGNDLGTGYVIDVYNPFQTEKTNAYGIGTYTGNIGVPYLETLGFIHTQAVSYDGISLIAVSSTWVTGKAVVYGYRQ